MKLLRAGAAGDRDAGAGHAAELGYGGGGLHAEFLNRLDGNDGVQAAEGAERGQRATGGLGRHAAGADAHVGAHAIDGEVVGIGAHAAGSELAGVAAGCGHHAGAGDQFEQGEDAAAVEGQVGYFVEIEAAAGGGVLALQRGSDADHGDAVLDAAHGQTEILMRGGAAGELDAELHDDSEALFAHGDFVAARGEGADRVHAAGFGEYLAAEAGIFVDDGHHRIGDAGLGRIEDLPEEFGIVLRPGWSHGRAANDQ